ncbi:MAG: DEAD/DEAH box helicase [Planctomycetota bacterium]
MGSRVPDGIVPGMDEEADTPGDFTAFGLHPDVLRGVTGAGFDAPRPIQSAVLSHALEGGDVLGLARTGTGKTAAFALPILQRVAEAERAPGAPPLALVVAPTRELAQQIRAEIERLGAHVGVAAVALHGGVRPGDQRDALAAGVDVVVATTGRLLDLVGSGDCDLSRVETLVLDEADRLFDMGFLADVRRIVELVPAERQTMMFSATMPEAVQALAQSILREPEIVDLGRSLPAETIDHALHPVRASAKDKLLRAIVDAAEDGSVLVFVRTKRGATEVAHRLRRTGRSIELLHGDRRQGARRRALDAFRGGEVDVLVATDLAARGLDVEGVGTVVNYDVPREPDAYVHRIGRTGRAERSGTAITIATEDEREHVAAIEERIGARLRRRYLDGFAVLDLAELADEAQARRPRRRRRR